MLMLMLILMMLLVIGIGIVIVIARTIQYLFNQNSLFCSRIGQQGLVYFEPVGHAEYRLLFHHF